MDDNSDSSINDKNLNLGTQEQEDFSIRMPNMDQFKEVYKLYKHKLQKYKNLEEISQTLKKFWDLIEKDTKGEINKNGFLLIFGKIYKFLLPVYNHIEINNFLEGEWLINRKHKPTMDYKSFSNYLFRLVHIWTVHINKEEYYFFLKMIYDRITKYVRITSTGEISYYPKYNISIKRIRTPEEYEKNTWEDSDDKNDFDLYEYEVKHDDDHNIDEKNYKRPVVDYIIAPHIINYNETIEYESDIFMERDFEIVKPILLSDEEIVIYGYPTQFILNYIKNNLNMLSESKEMKKSAMKISVNKEIENIDKSVLNHNFVYTFEHNRYECKIMITKEIINQFIKVFTKENYFILSWDIFANTEIDIRENFEDEYIRIYNNIQLNEKFDRYLNFHEIELPNKYRIIVNVDSLMINSSHKKALENIIIKKSSENTVNKDEFGIKSHLWNETIYDKLNSIIKNKFSIVYKKISFMLFNSDEYENMFEKIRSEINQIKDNYNDVAIEDFKIFKKFETKTGIEYDRWDSDYDIIAEANRKSPIVLVIGPPLVGKSSVCKKLADELKLVYVEPEIYLKNLFEKISKIEEEIANMEDIPDIDENNPDNDPDKPVKMKPKPTIESKLSKLEYEIYSQLINGKCIQKETLIDLYKNILFSDLAFSRGILIDQNSSIAEVSFAEMLTDGTFGLIDIDYIIELNIDQDDLARRKNSVRLNLKTMDIITKRDIQLMEKPIVKKPIRYPDEEVEEGEAMEEGEQEISEEDKEKIPKEKDLLYITNYNEIYQSQYDYYYNIQKPIFDKLISKLKLNYYVNIDVSGLDIDDVADLIKLRLDFIYRPRSIPFALEPADYKDLLMSGREGIVPFRRWSLWKQIDPVSLYEDYLILKGNTEFAADYCGRVFIFVDELKRNKFIENPKKYLKIPPRVPNNYRVAIFGLGKSGKNSVADILTSIFGWKKVNLTIIYDEIKEWQKSLDEFIPNSVYASKIHFSAAEWKEMTTPPKKGETKKPENFNSKIVFMLDFLGIRLDKKMTFEQYKENINYHCDKLYHLLNPPKKKTETRVTEGAFESENITENKPEDLDLPKDEMNELVEEIPVEEVYDDPYPPEEYLIEDIRSDEFYYAFNEDGTYQRPGGFILISHPSSEDEINKFKAFNISIDKIINLVDQSEEPYKGLLQRRNPHFNNLDEEKQGAEIEKVKTEATKLEEIIALLKEKFNRPGDDRNNEDFVIDINFMDSLSVIKDKLILSIDPFYTRIDPEEKIYVNADVPEEKIPIPKGEYGIFCPVTFKEDNWLFYTTEEFETQVNQRRYRFAGEKEIELFKKNPIIYLNKELTPVEVPPPHIYIIGHQGGGISFYSNYLSKQYKLKNIELKKEFMHIWDDKRLARKNVRVNKKREELKIQKEEQEKERKEQIAQNPELAEQEFEEMNIEDLLQNDAALDEEEETFNSVENDKSIFKSLFNPSIASVYDGSWFDMNEKITTPILEFLYDTRRTPNVFIIIRVSLKTIFERHLDVERIKNEFAVMEKASKQKKIDKMNNMKRERKEEKMKELMDEEMNRSNPREDFVPELKEEDYALTPEEINEIMEEADPDLPELETLMNSEKEKLIKTYEDNTNFLNDFVEQLKTKMIPYIEIANDLEQERVIKNINYQLEAYIKKRINLIEKDLTYIIPDNLTIRKTKELKESQIIRPSAYHTYSPVNPEKLISTTGYPIVYRDRVYFFNNLEEQKQFVCEPLAFRTGKEFPLDVNSYSLNNINLREIIYVIGNIQSGKTTTSKCFEQIGYYRLTLKRALEFLINNLQECVLKERIINILTRGEIIDDELAVKAISKRLKMSDIINKNIIIDGFPFNDKQIKLLEIEKIYPSCIFVCQPNVILNYERCKKQKGFKGLNSVILERFKNRQENMNHLIFHLINKEYDIIYINTEKNIWYLKDLFINLLEIKRKDELLFTYRFSSNTPAVIKNIIPIKVLKSILNTRERMDLFSSVAMKLKGEYYNLSRLHEFIIYYKGEFYFLYNNEEVDKFNESCITHIKKMKYDTNPPKILKFEKISEIITRDELFEYQDCCPVSLFQDKIIKEGKLNLTIEYKSKFYKFDSEEKMLKFYIQPEKYINIVVQVKTSNDQMKNNQIQVNFENTVGYLESNFGSLIMKGMLELLANKNKIKYPFLDVKETSCKYLALFLKANNPNNNDYAKAKYKKKFNEFVRNSMLPFELLDIYENYKRESNPLKKELIRKQLDNMANKYDQLIEKAKIQHNSRFENFFKN